MLLFTSQSQPPPSKAGMLTSLVGPVPQISESTPACCHFVAMLVGLLWSKGSSCLCSISIPDWGNVIVLVLNQDGCHFRYVFNLFPRMLEWGIEINPHAQIPSFPKYWHTLNNRIFRHFGLKISTKKRFTCSKKWQPRPGTLTKPPPLTSVCGWRRAVSGSTIWWRDNALQGESRVQN